MFSRHTTDTRRSCFKDDINFPVNDRYRLDRLLVDDMKMKDEYKQETLHDFSMLNTECKQETLHNISMLSTCSDTWIRERQCIHPIQGGSPWRLWG